MMAEHLYKLVFKRSIKKALLDVLGDKQTELEAFIKDQKLKLSKEEDVMKVLEKYEGQ